MFRVCATKKCKPRPTKKSVPNPHINIFINKFISLFQEIIYKN